MGRLRSAVSRTQALNDTHAYAQGRALAWLLQDQICLGTDYILRALNLKPKCPVNLVLGKAAALALGERELLDRCNESLIRLQRQRNAPSVDALLRKAPSSTQHQREGSLRVLERAAAASASAASSPRIETLVHRERVTLDATQRMVDEAVARCHQPAPSVVGSSSPAPPLRGRVLVLEPHGSPSGRGLYTHEMVEKGAVLLSDDLLLGQRMTEEVCAHCFAPLSKVGGESLGIPCERCAKETYCSASCRDLAWSQYHQCMCASVNPAFGEWASTLQRQLSSPDGGGEGDDARTALSCMAAAKLFAVCTVRQCHPSELPGVSHLRGFVEFDARAALNHLGAVAVTLSALLHQPNLHLEELLTVLSVWQTNEFSTNAGVCLYPILSLLNHSCTPNCVVVGSTLRKRQLVAVQHIRAGEQLLVDYNPQLTGSLTYEQRKQLFHQRNFECFCSKCVMRK